jgi:hypothetical protein
MPFAIPSIPFPVPWRKETLAKAFSFLAYEADWQIRATQQKALSRATIPDLIVEQNEEIRSPGNYPYMFSQGWMVLES